MIRGDVPKYYNDKDRDENFNKKVGYLTIYNQLIIKTQLVVNKNNKILINTNELTKLIKK